MVTATQHRATAQSGRQVRSSGAPPGPRKPGERQGALLDAAATLFVEKGVATTSIDDIVLRAGVAKGTFYHYFQDRAAMLEALRGRYSQQFAEVVQAALQACPPGAWDAKLEIWATAVVRQYIATYALHEAIFHDPSLYHSCIMSQEPIVRDLAALLETGIAAQTWETEDPLATALCMFHAAHGLLDEAIALEKNMAAVAPKLARLFIKMVRP